MQMGTRYAGTGRREVLMTNKHHRWTQTHINDLRSGVASGMEVAVIADTLGRTVEDTRVMILRLRLRVAG